MADKAAVNDGAGISVSVRLKSDELAALDEIAERDRISRAEVLRRFVSRGAGSLPGGEEFRGEITAYGDSRWRAGRTEGRMDRVREVEATQRNAAAVLVYAVALQARCEESMTALAAEIPEATRQRLNERFKSQKVQWGVRSLDGRQLIMVDRASVLQAVADAMKPAGAGPRLLPVEVPHGKGR